jgi:hypothetical protein
MFSTLTHFKKKKARGCLHMATVRIQELPQPGDSRPVLPPSQRTLSVFHSFMKVTIEKSGQQPQDARTPKPQDARTTGFPLPTLCSD